MLLVVDLVEVDVRHVARVGDAGVRGVGMRGRHGVLLGCGWLTGGSGGRAERMRGVYGAGMSTSGSGCGVAGARRGEAAVARADGVEGAGSRHGDARGVLASRLGRTFFEHVDQG